MKFWKVASISIAFVWASGFANAQTQTCPEWVTKMDPTIPVCPGSALLPETFPIGAVIVSDMGFSGKDSAFTADFVQKVLTASKDKNPMIILPASDETVRVVKSRIDAMPISAELKEKYKRAIVHVPVEGYTWQQDYMQAGFDQKTGRIVIRQIQSQKGTQGDKSALFAGVVKALNACGIQAGSPLTAGPDIWDGKSGGNIEAAAGGLCFLGDKDFETQQRWESFANQLCGAEKTIKVPTAWLAVGHSDEIVRVIENKNEKAPCNFAITIASPKKAMDLLKQNPNQTFLDSSKARSQTPSQASVNRMNIHRGLQMICDGIGSPSPGPNLESGRKNRGVTKHFLMPRALIAEAFAYSAEDAKRCAKMTNGEVYQFMMRPGNSFKIYNDLAQKKMDELKENILQQMQKSLPQCSPQIVEVPDLFFNGDPVQDKVLGTQLPKDMGLSVLPNPANSVTVNGTVISPEPANQAFREYMSAQYQRLGLNAEFVDTFEYAHLGSGNLHCATNTVPLCRPKGRQ